MVMVYALARAWKDRLTLALALATLLVPTTGTFPTSIALADGSFITVASTTSTENSGLFAYILPKFTATTGIEVRVVAKGTGQAIRLAQAGDADVLLVHHRPSEDKYVAQGYGVDRRDVMYNDFVLIGPGSDPAGVSGGKDTAAALKKIAAAKGTFVSRGDDSGTHKKELSLWKAAGVDPKASSGSWYREVGAGMGAALNTAAGMGAYILSDRATWIAFKNKKDLKIVVQGDDRLFNPYGVILVNPKRFKHVKEKEGLAFLDWLTGSAGRKAIADFKLEGRQVFFLHEK